MKSSIKLILLLIFVPLTGNTQTDFKKGFIITNSNEKLDGAIKEYLRSKGSITFLFPDGSKKNYAASDIQGFSMDSINFISYCNDFYKEVSTGSKARLYQKVTNNSDKILYNGFEVVGFAKTTEGKGGDYYLLPGTKKELDLITKKAFKKYFLTLLNENERLRTKIKDGTLGYAQIVKLVELYNN